MNRPNRAYGSLLLAATLTMSAAAVSCSTPQTVTVVEKAPDPHPWDDHEDQAWHRFLTEKNRPNHEYAKSEKNEQSEYWTWRHDHPN